VNEAYNADRVRDEFEHLKFKSSLYIPEILWAERRCMAMECESDREFSRRTLPTNDRLFTVIDGARVDDLVYLKNHRIDRNKVSQELSRIFSEMVYMNGCERSTTLYLDWQIHR
jgi:aarF domain-containing kinase